MYQSMNCSCDMNLTNSAGVKVETSGFSYSLNRFPGCWAYTYNNGHLDGSKPGDIIFYFEMNDAPTNVVQQLVYGSSAATHTTTCAYGTSTTCNWYNHSDGYGFDFANADITIGRGFTNNLALVSLPPGITNSEIGTYHFGWTDVYRTNTALQYLPQTNSGYHMSAYTTYLQAGQCAEYVVGYRGLNSDEGKWVTSIGVPAATTVSSQLWNSIYGHCKDQKRIGWEFYVTPAGWIVQILRNDTCSGIAYQALNTMWNRPTYGTGSYSAGLHAIGNLSGTQDVHLKLSGLAAPPH
jgi:hypothetical protein